MKMSEKFTLSNWIWLNKLFKRKRIKYNSIFIISVPPTYLIFHIGIWLLDFLGELRRGNFFSQQQCGDLNNMAISWYSLFVTRAQHLHSNWNILTLVITTPGRLPVVNSIGNYYRSSVDFSIKQNKNLKTTKKPLTHFTRHAKKNNHRLYI